MPARSEIKIRLHISDQLGTDVLIGFRIFYHGTDMDSPFMREGTVPHIGLIFIVTDVGQFVDKTGKFTDFFQTVQGQGPGIRVLTADWG